MGHSASRTIVGAAVVMALVATGGAAHGVDAPPIAVEDRYVSPAGSTIRVDAAKGVLANDTSTDRAHLTASLVVAPRYGTLVLRTDGSFVYRPGAGYEGKDSFGYRAIDGNGRSAMRAAKLTINRGPRSQDDVVSTRPGVRLLLAAPGVLANDVDTLGLPLTAVILTRPLHGTVFLSPRGALDYTPAARFVGIDTFTYRARDGFGAWSRATTVTIRVEVPNRAPVARADTFTTGEDFVLEVSAPGVLANDSDPDGDALIAEMVGSSSGGNAWVEPDGSFVVEPGINQDGDITFRYRVGDGRAWSATVEVFIDVIADNDPPETGEDQFTAWTGSRLEVPAPGVLVNDSDPVEFDGLTARILTQPATGTVTMAADGSFTFDPDPGPSRYDSFTYLACDTGSCTTGSVGIEVFGDDDGGGG